MDAPIVSAKCRSRGHDRANHEAIFQLSAAQAKILVCLFGILIATVDLSTRADVNVSVFYVIGIVLLGFTRSLKWLWVATIIFILLTFAVIVLAPASGVYVLSWVHWVNRSMTALALVVAAVPVHLRLQTLVSLERNVARRQQAEDALGQSNQLLEQRVVERTTALAVTLEELQKENASRIQVENELRESEASLRELSLELLNAQDEERRNIGQELHDGIGQTLVAIKMGLHFLNPAVLAADTEVRKYFAECFDLTDQALLQTRTLSHLLYPPLLDEGGIESAVPWYVRSFEQRSGIKTTSEIPTNMGRLPQVVERTVFRILQESLTNVHRHSGSQTAAVRIQVADGSITLIVSDSGKGITGGAIGVGLRSMQERVKQLKGTFEIASGLKGTTVTANFPNRGQSMSMGAS